MGKIKKQRTTKKRASPYDDNAMVIDVGDSVSLDCDPATQKPLNVDATETSHAMTKRHAQEWREMKKEVTLLKKRRKTLRKKVLAEREEKKQISKKIKMLLETTRNRHLDEIGKKQCPVEENETKMLMDNDE